MCRYIAKAMYVEKSKRLIIWNGLSTLVTFHNWCSCIEIVDRPFISQVISLELSTGIPMLYIFKEGKFIRRGSPAGPSEAGVYAYTKVRIFSASWLG